MKLIHISTRGHTDIIDITSKVQQIIDDKNFRNGVVHLFVIGSTASLSTCENDENVFEDLREILNQIAPYDKNWKHHKTWEDDNGAAHIRATILGPSLSIPVEGGKLVLGTWQHIILLDFDTKPRKRDIVVNLLK
jgi:secondary thiamine-phosphate synthase enzyme